MTQGKYPRTPEAMAKAVAAMQAGRLDPFRIGDDTRPYYNEDYWCLDAKYAPGRIEMRNRIERGLPKIIRRVLPILKATEPIKEKFRPQGTNKKKDELSTDAILEIDGII